MIKDKKDTAGRAWPEHSVSLRLNVVFPSILCLFSAAGILIGFYIGTQGLHYSVSMRELVVAVPLYSMIAILAGLLLARHVSTPLQKIVSRIARLYPPGQAFLSSVPGTEADMLQKAADYLFPVIEGMGRDADEHDRPGRLMALGYLTSGIVHELRNPIGALIGLLDIVTENVRQGTPCLYHLERARAIGMRLNRIVLDVLDFARPGAAVSSECRLDDVVEQAVIDAAHDMEAMGVLLEKELNAGVKLAADPDQINRVISNLLRNAIDAAGEGGRVAISTMFARVDGLDGKDGDSVLFVIENSGQSIPCDIREMIFDPFVSGKRGGTGLGLSIAYRIVMALGGRLRLVRSDMNGTVFEMSLPCKRATGQVDE
jgi:signal transduction histidine kinase